MKKAEKEREKDKEKCQICDEKYSKSTRTPITCLHCEFKACRKCCEQYLLNTSEPKCMNTTCNKPWTRKFLVSTMTQSFLNEKYKTYCERLFFEKEQALLPATQAVVERIIECDKIREEIAAIDKEWSEWEQKRRDIIRRRVEHSEQLRRTLRSDERKERRQFIRRCGDTECRGFLSTAWKCGLCEKWTCRDCHAVKHKVEEGEEDQHHCNPDDVETAKLLSQDSKPCPKCATLIFKIDGCDQMWCTQCHTAFSWNRGTIEAHIHNPHYYEWLRRTGGGQAPREAGDVLCGQELHHGILPHKLNQLDTELYKRLQHTLIAALHIERVEVPRFEVDNVVNNEGLRVRYMRNQIDEPTFKILLQREHKKHEKKREIHDILRLFTQSITDILYRCRHVYDEEETRRKTRNYQPTPWVDEMNKILDEVGPLVTYVNECLEDVSNIFKCVTWRIDLYNRHRHYFGTIIKKRAVVVKTIGATATEDEW
jgi:hypothetical protein